MLIFLNNSPFSFHFFAQLLTIFLILALPLLVKQSEMYYQEKFAREIGGKVEVGMKNGTRCDILTATHAIYVDFARKWMEAIDSRAFIILLNLI
jgi:hypothetical protein